MRNSKLKNQKGAISIFVLSSMLFLVITIIGIYMISARRAQTQTESVGIIKEKYYTEGQENTIYNQKVSTVTTNIPIYTKEQLWLIGSGKKVEIDGTIYTFASTSTYQLQNDIVINIEEVTGTNFNESSVTNLNKGSYQIYYYSDTNKQYYMSTTGTADYTDGYGNKYAVKN